MVLAGVQNSFRCLVADILCLAKRVNRYISAKCDKARKSRHSSQMRPATYHLPPATCHLPTANCHLLPADCHLSPATCYPPHASCHLPLPPVTCHLQPATTFHISKNVPGKIKKCLVAVLPRYRIFCTPAHNILLFQRYN